MSERPGNTPSIRRLVDDLHGDAEPVVELSDLPDWLAVSPSFRAFVEANRAKIRKKLRGATTGPARLDVRAELRAAARLLADRRFDVAFEAYGAGRRGPDFTVTYRAGRPFNVEVTRRSTESRDASLAPSISGKLRQLPVSASNVLVIAVDGPDAAPDPGPVVRELRARADRHDDALFARLGPGNAGAFHAGLLRLAVVVTWAEAAGPGSRVASWANAGARIPLPEATLRALLAALAADP